MSDPPDAVERVLPIQGVILHAMHGQQTWLQPSHVLGISPRTMRPGCWLRFTTGSLRDSSAERLALHCEQRLASDKQTRREV